MTAIPVGDEARTHEAPYRVRFDEAGPDGLLRTSGFLRYAQDVAWQHSVALGFGREWYAERGLTWLVRAAELEVLAPVPMGSSVVSRTAVVGQRRVWARRRGEFRLTDETLAAWVQTDWVLVDARGGLVRIPALFEERFRIPETSARMCRVTLPPTPTGATRRVFDVRPQELDPMDHVNNAVYVDWFEEALLAATPEEARALLTGRPRHYRLEYASAADGGARLKDAVWPEAGGWSYRVSGSGGSDLFRAAVGPGAAEAGSDR